MPGLRAAFLSVLSVCFVTPHATSADDSYLIQYKFRPGQFAHYQVETESTMKLTARQTRQTLHKSKSTRKHFRVVSVDENGTAVLETVLDHVVMKAQSDDEEPVVFDSEDRDQSPGAFKDIANAIGKPTARVRFDSSGRVRNVLPVNGRKPVIDDESKFAFLVPMPTEPIEIGHTWKDDFKIQVSVDPRLRSPLTRPIQIRREYRLEKIESDLAVISFRTFPLSVEKNPHIQTQLIQRSISGSIQFDLKKGLIVEWKSEGTGEVFNPFGQSSSMQAELKSVERYVAKNSPRKHGPIGPQLPGSR